MKAVSCQHIRRKTPEREKITPRDQSKNKAVIEEEEARKEQENKPTANNIHDSIPSQQEDIKT